MVRWVRVYCPLACMLCCALTIAACWIIPWRLHQGGSYLFGYCPDEYTYANRLQPLIPGTTSNNPINGIGDSNVIAPFFLDDLCRGIATITGFHIESLFWLWRITFPLVMLAAVALLVRECSSQARRSFRKCIYLSLGAAAFPLIYCCYDLVGSFPPLQGYINRIPTGIEYPLSILLLLLFVRLLNRPDIDRATFFVLAAAILIHLRPYIAIPWALTMGICIIVLTIRKLFEVRIAVYMTTLFIVCMTPLFSISYWNSLQSSYVDMTDRFFRDIPFTLQYRWPLYAGAGVVFALWSRLLNRPWNLFAICAGVTMWLSIFIFNAFKFRQEMVGLDRMGAFYLTVPITLIAWTAGQRALSWRGKRGVRNVLRLSFGCIGIALVAASVLASENAHFDFAAQPLSPYQPVVDDLKYVPAYRWIHENLPESAFFLVDDGRDWAHFTSSAEILSEWEKQTQHDDLFSIIARRRRVFHQNLYRDILSNQDYSDLYVMHHGTFGAPKQVDSKYYLFALNHWRPDYVLWKKCAPIPRAFGGVLAENKEVVYSDDVAEIWKVSYPLKIKN